MCMERDKIDADKVRNSKHLDLLVHHNGYAVMKDTELDLHYFCRIDKHFNPLNMYDGSSAQVNAMLGHFVKTGRLLWAILE